MSKIPLSPEQRAARSLLLCFMCLAGSLLIAIGSKARGDSPWEHVMMASSDTFSGSITPAYVSQFMYRGQLLDGACWQPEAELDYGPWALGTWVSTPLSHKIPDFVNPEVDIYGSYNRVLTPALTLQPGFLLYTYPKAPLDSGNKRSTFEPSLALIYALGPVTLTPKLYYDVTLRVSTYELTAGYSRTLWSRELDFSVLAGAYSGTALGNYWQLGVALPFTVTKASKLIIGFAYQEGWSDEFGSQGRGIISASYSYTF